VVLEEAIRKKVIDEVPVCLDGMIYEATAIHTTYPEYLNNDLRDLIFHKGINPFLAECFVQVESPKQRTEIVEGPPCVILATSGMLNGGPVIEYLKRLGPDEKNTLVIVGYQAEGTLWKTDSEGMERGPAISRRKDPDGEDQPGGYNSRWLLRSLRSPAAHGVPEAHISQARPGSNQPWRGGQLSGSGQLHLQEIPDSHHGSHEPGNHQADLIFKSFIKEKA